MSVTVSTFMQELLPYTPGAVRAVVKRAIRRTAREFYRQTFAWRDVRAGLSLTPGQSAVGASYQDNAVDIVAILSVEIDGRPLQPLSRRPPDGTYNYAEPMAYYMASSTDTTSGAFILVPGTTAGVAGTLAYEMALAPNLTADYFPDMTQYLYYEAIVDGALGKLLAQPAKPYSNPTLAQYHLKRFRAAIAQARATGKSGMQAGSPPWQFPAFAN